MTSALATTTLQVPLAEAFLGDGDGPVGKDHADGHFVESDLAVDVGADAHVAAQQQERAGGQGVAGARGDDRDRRAVEASHQFAAVAHQRHDCAEVTTTHHPEVEAGTELARPTVQHERTDGVSASAWSSAASIAANGRL